MTVPEALSGDLAADQAMGKAPRGEDVTPTSATRNGGRERGSGRRLGTGWWDRDSSPQPVWLHSDCAMDAGSSGGGGGG